VSCRKIAKKLPKVRSQDTVAQKVRRLKEGSHFRRLTDVRNADGFLRKVSPPKSDVVTLLVHTSHFAGATARLLFLTALL
jgi:hypothetical protein